MPSFVRRSIPSLLFVLFATSSCASVMSATKEHDADAVAKMLASGAKPDEESDGVRALCQAITQNDTKIVDLLVKAKADVNKSCKQGEDTWTPPLLVAGEYADAKTVKLLLDAGADPFAKNNGDRGMRFLAYSARFSENRDAGEKTSAYLDYVERVHGRDEMLALANGRDERLPPLPAAAWQGDPGAVRQLVAHGVDPNATWSKEALFDGDDEWPAIIFARVQARYDSKRSNVVDALVQAGARADATTRDGQSADAAFKQFNAVNQARKDAKHAQERAAADEARAERLRQNRQSQQIWTNTQQQLAPKPAPMPVGNSTTGSSGSSGASKGGSGYRAPDIKANILMEEAPPPPATTQAPPPPPPPRVEPPPPPPPPRPASTCTGSCAVKA